jgi:hypothetical protein
LPRNSSAIAFHPLDGGIRIIDGRSLLGASTTIRAVLLAILLASAGALLIGVGLTIGTLVGGISYGGRSFFPAS